MALTLEPQLPCPFPRGNIDFARRILKLAEKTWLAKEILLGKQTGAGLERTYNMPARRLTEWAQMLRQRGYLREKGGRPAYLSAADKKELHVFVDQPDYQPDLDDVKKHCGNGPEASE